MRGGVGVFYDILKGEDNLQFNGSPPFYSEPSVYFSPQATVGGVKYLYFRPGLSIEPFRNEQHRHH